MNVEAARKFCKKHKLPVEDLNAGKEPEKIGQLSFIDFWKAKRQILDLVWAHDRSIWNLGNQSNKTLSQYKKIDQASESLIERLTGEKIREDENQVWSSWATAENSRLIVYPRAIIKILEWMKAHGNVLEADRIEKDLGYSKEELVVFLRWFVNHVDAKLEQQEKDMQFAAAMADFIGKL